MKEETEDYTSVYMQGYYAGKDKAFKQNEQERQEYRKLLDEHKQLETNWNELKKRVEKQREIGQAQEHYMTVNVCNLFLSEMQELEQGKDEN